MLQDKLVKTLTFPGTNKTQRAIRTTHSVIRNWNCIKVALTFIKTNMNSDWLQKYISNSTVVPNSKTQIEGINSISEGQTYLV